MKLEQLTPYLAHDVRMMVDYDGPQFISGMPDLCHVTYYDERTDAGDDLHIEDVKLILHPLSDLTEPITVNGELVIPVEELYNDSWMALGYKIIFNDDNILQIQSNEDEDSSTLDVYKKKPQVNMWWVTQKLISMHFDVFSLIDNNLAININTLEK